jgi:hypothetical protein
MARGKVYQRITGTHLNVGTSEETEIVLSDKSEPWLLVSFHYVRSGGSGSTYTPRLGQAASFTNGDINERMVFSSTAVGTATNDVFAVPIPCWTDSSGKLYFRPAFNSGSDNDGDYEFVFFRGR